MDKRVETIHPMYGEAIYPQLADDLQDLFDKVAVNQGISYHFQLILGVVQHPQFTTQDKDGSCYEWFSSAQFVTDEGKVIVAFPWKTDAELKIDNTVSGRRIATFRDCTVSAHTVNESLGVLVQLFTAMDLSQHPEIQNIITLPERQRIRAVS